MNDYLSQYASMQKAFYDETSYDVEEIVTRNARGFEIGCGEGRMVGRMARLLRQVDGDDISEKMVNAARERTPGAEIYLSSGTDCGAASSNTYDFAYCAISMQHICVYDTRASILSDVVRILKPGACATLQFFFSKYYPYCRTASPPVNDSFLIDIQWFTHMAFFHLRKPKK